jgi:hypothetical protein
MNMIKKRKYINFVSAVKVGSKGIRLNDQRAFINCSKLSGILEGVRAEVSIKDGDINLEICENNSQIEINDEMIHRLIESIDHMSIVGYAGNFVIENLEFESSTGKKCFLSVENKKPIEKFEALLNEVAVPKVSEKARSILDSLFPDHLETVSETPMSAEVIRKDIKSQYILDSFSDMNESKIKEIESRISDNTNKINNAKLSISRLKKELDELIEQGGILERRLENLQTQYRENGWVFNVSEIQKIIDCELSPEIEGIVNKIANALNLKANSLIDTLMGGFYKIRIAPADNIESENFEIPSEIISKINSIDYKSRINLVGMGIFEYRGDLNWHSIVDKMIKSGFAQSPKFDEICNSNSYISKFEN